MAVPPPPSTVRAQKKKPAVADWCRVGADTAREGGECRLFLFSPLPLSPSLCRASDARVRREFVSHGAIRGARVLRCAVAVPSGSPGDEAVVGGAPASPPPPPARLAVRCGALRLLRDDLAN
ncbi:uncharacterized protein Tco025E_09474 [Trypanosoma conorhini]|uniref:Uncharacterized protein n=1 Tax=Trypanosoma conorhini TaxID=83891 RepID=A0A3R7KBP2_9TRYP|nr:uncharacterized protein Tco025E_09474 [Trypanosoma conorhini]RNE97381.1 hypothetical protein Tco025E_09474 [Trypanosoma conorhini]